MISVGRYVLTFPVRKGSMVVSNLSRSFVVLHTSCQSLLLLQILATVLKPATESSPLLFSIQPCLYFTENTEGLLADFLQVLLPCTNLSVPLSQSFSFLLSQRMRCFCCCSKPVPCPVPSASVLLHWHLFPSVIPSSSPLCIPMFLNWGWFCYPGDIWQYLETFFVVTTGW
uniref:Uncharacterized protein n=1 Tax=Myotis myotis TaxID=51298 RepID=A0A7J7YE27_MYOMY|nr:hypothetical protein mMyoMyo1_011187 [Myotis myotis]